MENVFTLFLICIFEYCMLFYFFEYTLGSKTSMWIKYIVFIFSVCITTAINIIDNSIVNLISVPFLCFCVVAFIFNGNLRTKLFLVIIFCTIMSSVEIVSEFIFIDINSGTEINSYKKIFIILIEKILTFIILRSIRRIFFDSKEHGSGKYFWLFFITPISSFFIYGGILYSDINVNSSEEAIFFIISGSILMLFANILVFYLFEKNFQISSQAKALELAFTKTDLEEKFYKKLEKLNYDHSRYIHDLNHYLKAIYCLANENECGKIINIISNMQINISKLDDDRICYHKILDIFLSEKKSEADQYDIPVLINVEYNVDLSFLSDYDLICILGNLLDNAIEASKKVYKKERFIDIHIFEANTGGFLMIVIKNSYDGKIVKRGLDIITTKQYRESHGFGIMNVRDVVEKNGGFLNIGHENKEFIVSAALPVSRI